VGRVSLLHNPNTAHFPRSDAPAKAGLFDFRAPSRNLPCRNMFPGNHLQKCRDNRPYLQSGWIQVRVAQLNNWVANQKYPGLINAGRRPKTSACLLLPTLLPVFFRGFRLSESPRIGTALGQVPMICRQSCRILAPNSRGSRSLLGNGVIRKLRSRAEWETNTEIPFFQCS